MEPATTPPTALATLATRGDLAQVRADFTRFMMEYKFGMDAIESKISILQEEFTYLHDYNPIEHVLSRLKSPESILEKVRRRGLDPSFESIREHITDIAGVRVTCSFVRDVYQVYDMLTGQEDVEVLAVKDYIAEPKPNGYRSLHGLLRMPVHLSDRVVPVTVELQLRTVAMDFWASLEHKIYYKYQSVPADLLGQLRDAADTAAQLDQSMERLHEQMRIRNGDFSEDTAQSTPTDEIVQELATLIRERNREHFV